jgi:hypothetical protein
MREYGKIYATFWSSEDMRSLTEDGRMLAVYLMTCPHGNMLGCFRLPDAYVAEDMQWDPERVSKGFEELFRKGFAYRCERTSWVFIRKHLEWNPFENPNVGLAAGKLFDSLSAPPTIKALLVKALRENSPRFPVQKLEDFETLSIPFENPFETLSKPVAVAVAVAVAPTRAVPKPEPRAKSTVEPAPDTVIEVFSYWQKKMGHPNSKLDAKRRKAILARLNDGYTVSDLCKAVDGCHYDPFSQGANDRNTVYDDIELICRTGIKVDHFVAIASRGPQTARPANTQATFDALQRAMENP